MDPQSASSQASSQEVSGLQGLVQGGMASLAKPSSPAPPSPATGPPLSGDAANLQSFLDSTEPTAPMAQQRPGWLDRDDPLDSYSAATLSGIKSIVRGGRDAVKGTVQLLDPRPQNQEEEAIIGADQRNSAALPLYRILRSMGHTASQATQITGALHDINQSPDPLGTYLKVGQETAGQGAGQALTALATEGLTRAIPKVPAALESPATQAVAAGTKAALKKLPAAAVKRIPYVGKVAGDVADAARTAYNQVKTARTAAAAPGASAADELEGVTSPQTEAAGQIPDEAEVEETPAPQARPQKPARKPAAAAAATSAAPQPAGTEALAKEFATKVYGHLRNMLGMEGTAETSAPAAGGTPAETPPAGASPAGPKESVEDFVNRVMPPSGRAQAKPNAEAQAVDSETGEPVSEPDMWDKLPKEEQKRRLDEYYAKHPEQKPKPQSWQRGPKKGQPKVRRVFDEGKWHEVQVYE